MRLREIVVSLHTLAGGILLLLPGNVFVTSSANNVLLRFLPDWGAGLLMAIPSIIILLPYTDRLRAPCHLLLSFIWAFFAFVVVYASTAIGALFVALGMTNLATLHFLGYTRMSQMFKLGRW